MTTSKKIAGGAFCFLLLGMIFSCGNILAEDFDWSWEGSTNQAAPAVEPESDPGQEFDWEWAEEGTKTPAAAPARARSWAEEAAPPRQAPTVPAVDPADYNNVMRENIELRKQLAEKERLALKATQEAERLAREKQLLQGQMNTLASTMEQLENEKADARVDLARVRELESQLTAAEDEKVRLARKMAELETNMQTLQQEKPAEAPVAEAPEPQGVQPGSDLFREVAQENARLKEQLAEIENVRAKAERMEDRVEQSMEQKEVIREQLKASKQTEEDQKQIIARLLRRIPEMESELTGLRERAGGKQSVLAASEREMENVREELRRREYRLVKAERMAAMLDEAREEVKAVTEEQQRNMHYNMAVVYAKEGRFKDAEQEYLRALRIDPAFADAHYNIAILYDDELSNKERAAMHYRKYLQLSPSAPDRDQVMQWIMRVEM